MNMLEMSKLVGNQAIKKGDEIATGKFDEEKTETTAASAERGKKGKKGKKAAAAEEEDSRLAKAVNAQVQGPGTPTR